MKFETFKIVLAVKQILPILVKKHINCIYQFIRIILQTVYEPVTLNYDYVTDLKICYKLIYFFFEIQHME